MPLEEPDAHDELVVVGALEVEVVPVPESDAVDVPALEVVDPTAVELPWSAEDVVVGVVAVVPEVVEQSGVLGAGATATGGGVVVVGCVSTVGSVCVCVRPSARVDVWDVCRRDLAVAEVCLGESFPACLCAPCAACDRCFAEAAFLV